MSENEGAPEIVVIRRGGHGHDDGHHGGMWKIAYADFMTALMALFLVLWLVNATDEQTQAQIASYFNPIDLSDSTTNKRGVHDKNQAGTGEHGEDNQKKPAKGEDKTTTRNDLGHQGTSDEALFSDPYGVLTKLAAKATKVPLPASEAAQQPNASPAAGGDAFRDPFDPNFRFNSNAEKAESGDFDPAYERLNEQKNEPAPGPEASLNPQASNPHASEGNPRSMPFADKLAEEAEKAAELAERKAKRSNEAEKPDAASEQPAAQTEAGQLKADLFKHLMQSGLASLPDISVEQTPEGILISVTDQADFEMFALSSAEPKPELVVLMEQLADVLAKQLGDIIIRGHTDGRPFRSTAYDNWRLSTARAHIAQYMLLRGGLPKERIERIEGYADRSLKVPADPNAAQNRRIEILLRPEKT